MDVRLFDGLGFPRAFGGMLFGDGAMYGPDSLYGRTALRPSGFGSSLDSACMPCSSGRFSIDCLLTAHGSNSPEHLRLKIRRLSTESIDISVAGTSLVPFCPSLHYTSQFTHKFILSHSQPPHHLYAGDTQLYYSPFSEAFNSTANDLGALYRPNL
jgi:hypothetical protein